MPNGLSCRRVGFVHHPNTTAEKTVLANIDVDFAAGGMSLITGKTGAGKTTLIHILAGIRRPSSGTVLADGQPVSRWTAAFRDQWRRKVGIVFQNHHLLEGLTVQENVMLPLIPRSLTLKELRTRTMSALERLDLGHLAGKSVVRLSTGERQRVAAARAIAVQPEYLLADEPTAHQDGSAAAVVLDVFAQIAVDSQATVVITAHDPRMATADAVTQTFRLSDGILTQTK